MARLARPTAHRLDKRYRKVYIGVMQHKPKPKPSRRPKRAFTYHLNLEQRAKMEEIKRRDGVPLATQIRFALAAWLAAK